MLGMVGGAIFTLAIAISSVQLSSSPQDMASYCCGSTSNLLLILDGIMLQVSQKSCTHQRFICYTKFFNTQQVSRPAFQDVPTQTPKHSTGWSTTTINMVTIILGWGISWEYVYVPIFSLSDTAPFVVSSNIIIMYKKIKKITPLPFF
jgi:hypothetical protein